MGWGTEVKVYANRITRKTAESEAEDAYRFKRHLKRQLEALVYATPEPHKDVEGNEMMPHEWLPPELDEMFDDLEDTIIKQFLAERVKSADDSEIEEDV